MMQQERYVQADRTAPRVVVRQRLVPPELSMPAQEPRRLEHVQRAVAASIAPQPD